ncbi:DUF563 domain-containing protein [Desertifilum sp. FACHB-1129]|uniref:Glycosyltransferase 61 catalytic domain-containing protein n=2 Tax=Desertifilum tharense IPPAS B-1220 TaxID=1781255 RepID=A0A1E5QCW0_9CYAN|nr:MULTISPECIES: glycosyltransferase 61 family protein [Desertifilum]MDA0211674.1 glycosyltransferase 61 family protein [Cyanobacteria bacterium FC1]MBD2312181.1 DUF563 domain-containing protein [Desertifilum sp. FACHB-1129]MBD2322157.1 DUF563 domain-containing protein [Desertifilum sp. FACHB-866]MBD2332194.1 DUF563 domain-containing protein [Desertifilum sp. FACHB-868]OEJ72441.1 hypothetical protein BH720_25555 [Desertifilum tharense IPPAS B-1220]
MSVFPFKPDEIIGTLTAEYQARKELQQQIFDLLQANQLTPSAENYYNLGVYLAQHQQWEGAIALFLHAVSLNPTGVDAYYNLGAVLQALQQYKSAIAFYYKGLSIEVDSQYYYHLAGCLLQLAQVEENDQYIPVAIAYLLQRLRLQPDCQSTYYTLGSILEQQGNAYTASQCDKFQLPTELIHRFYQLNPQRWQLLLPAQSHPDVRYCKLHEAAVLPLKPPKTLEAQIHPELNRHKDFYSSPTLVAEVQEGAVWCHSQADVVLTRDRQIVTMVSHANATILDIDRYLPPVSQTVETVALLSVLSGQAFYHWMFELLPKVGLIHLAGIDLNSIDKFIVNEYQAPFHKETLNHLGISSERIITSSQPIHIQANLIVVPYFELLSNWSCQFLRQELLSQSTFKTHKPELLYISRKNANYRHLLNEAEISDSLSQLGFTVVTLESYSFMEQVAFVANAKVIVSLHGAGLSHLVFCQPNTKIIEIFPPNYVTRYYWNLSNLVGLDYYYFMGEPNSDINLETIENINYHYITESFQVSLLKLLATLKFAEAI